MVKINIGHTKQMPVFYAQGVYGYPLWRRV